MATDTPTAHAIDDGTGASTSRTNALALVAGKQGAWSACANRLKGQNASARSITFALSILGAILAVVASQRPEGAVRLDLAIASAASFAVVSLLTARLLDTKRVSAWIRARAASEALKREAYKYAAFAAPYDAPASRDAAFRTEVERIEEDVDDLAVLLTPAAGSTPSASLSPDDYQRVRVRKAIEGFFEPKSILYARRAARLRRVEFCLALATACLTAIVGVAGKDPAGWGFDFVALTAFMTTLGGMVLAHIEVQRYEFLAVSYRATARRLDRELADAPPNLQAPSAEWSQFVGRCEAIMSEENGGWIAKWSK